MVTLKGTKMTKYEQTHLMYLAEEKTKFAHLPILSSLLVYVLVVNLQRKFKPIGSFYRLPQNEP